MQLTGFKRMKVESHRHTIEKRNLLMQSSLSSGADEDRRVSMSSREVKSND